MTMTADTPVDTSAWIQSNEDLAYNLAFGLHHFANMIDAHPEAAPLWAGMFRNLINPVAGADGMGVLIEAATAGGGAVSPADRGGFDLSFGPAVQVWLLTGAPTEPVPVVADSTPEPPVDEPAATEIQDDAETPAESADEPMTEVSAA